MPPAQVIGIKNKSSRSKTYTISHRGASLINARPLRTQAQTFPDVYGWITNDKASYAAVSFIEKVVVPPGATANLTATMVAPSDVDPALLPVYGGFIVITDDKLEYVIPYAGVPYRRADFLPSIRATT